jgi:hypothetical protein
MRLHGQRVACSRQSAALWLRMAQSLPRSGYSFAQQAWTQQQPKVVERLFRDRLQHLCAAIEGRDARGKQVDLSDGSMRSACLIFPFHKHQTFSILVQLE